MKVRYLVLGAAFLLAAGMAQAQDAKSIVQRAQMAMGNPATIELTGTGMNAFFGQALTAGKEWPRRDLESFRLAINYDQKAATQELNFKNPVFGGQRQNAHVNDVKAWSLAPAGANPQLAAAEERQLQIWMTPHGFLRAASASPSATVKAGPNGSSLVTFQALNKFTLTGTIDAQGLVTRVETLFPNPVLGDMPYAFTYSDYKDFGGVKIPTRIQQTGGGFTVNDLSVTKAQPNAPINIAVPDNVQAATMPAVRVESTKIGDGIWFVGGGSHHSVVVAFNDYIAVIEAPQFEARSLAVIAEAKKLVPGKPIKYVISTHHHFDHSGGLRTYVAEGATVVSHVSNARYWEAAFAAPATLVPDAQSTARKKPSLQSVTDKHVITDGKQTIEIYNTVGDEHSDELLVVYLPAIKALVEADSYSPGAAAGGPAPKNAVVLYDNIQRLKLDVATIIGVHGQGPEPIAQFKKFVGRN